MFTLVPPVRSGGAAAAIAALLVLGACAPAAQPSAPPTAPASTSPTPVQKASAPAAPAAASPAAPPAAAASPSAVKPAVKEEAAPKRESIKMAIPTKSFGYLPMFVALNMGFYAEEGLDAEWIQMTPSAAVPGVTSRQLTATVAGSGMRAAEAGAPLKAVFFYYKNPTWTLLAQSPIKDVKGLKGKKVGINNPGAETHQAMKTILAANGLDPEKDVVYVSIGSVSQSTIMSSGAVDATLMNTDQAAVLLTQGAYSVLAQARDTIADAPFSGWVVHDLDLTERRGALKRWIKANIRAMQFMVARPAEVAKMAATEFGMAEDVARSALDESIKAIDTADPGGFTEAGMRTWLRLNAEAFPEPGKVDTLPLAKIADLTLLREVQREIGIACKGGMGCS